MRNTGFSGENLSRDEIIQCGMKPEERERMFQLCALIEKERDHQRFLQLINELNDLLERKEKTLSDPAKE